MTDVALPTLLTALGTRMGHRLEVARASPDQLEVIVTPLEPRDLIVLSGPEVFTPCDILASGAARSGWEDDYRRLLTTDFHWQCFRGIRASAVRVPAQVPARGSRPINVKLVFEALGTPHEPCAEASVTIYARLAKASAARPRFSMKRCPLMRSVPTGVTLLAAAAAIFVAVPVASESPITIGAFLARAEAVRGPLSAFSGERRALMRELGTQARALRRAQSAPATRDARLCLPERAELNLERLLLDLEEMPASARRLPLSEGFKQSMIDRYPCR